MRSRLKQFRVRGDMTQATLAKKVGVAQPTYHRWETGSAPIPPDKLQKLAAILETTPEALRGRHPPVRARLYDNSAGDHLEYYGEVSVHFLGGGLPLLLSISEEAFQTLHRDLQTGAHFVTVQSLSNQTVLIRLGAISDLYFSSEAYDDFGPEHGSYSDHVSIQLPDQRDWEIIESLECGIDLEEFDPNDVQRVRQAIMITDEEYEELVADGTIQREHLDAERSKNQEKTEAILKLAWTVTYQLSDGKRRDIHPDDDRALYEAFCEMIDFDGGELDEIVRLEAAGRHRIAFINKCALDYVSIPTHKYENGSVEVAAELLDAS